MIEVNKLIETFQVVTVDTKMAGAFLTLKNATKVLADLWLRLLTLETETADEGARNRLREIRQEVSKQVVVLEHEATLFEVDREKDVFH